MSQPLIVRYDDERDLWDITEGTTHHVCSDGAFLDILGKYRAKVMTGNGHHGGLFDSIRELARRIDEFSVKDHLPFKGIQVAGYSKTEGLLIRDNDGSIYGRHGKIENQQAKKEAETRLEVKR